MRCSVLRTGILIVFFLKVQKETRIHIAKDISQSGPLHGEDILADMRSSVRELLASSPFILHFYKRSRINIYASKGWCKYWRKTSLRSIQCHSSSNSEWKWNLPQTIFVAVQYMFWCVGKEEQNMLKERWKPKLHKYFEKQPSMVEISSKQR